MLRARARPTESGALKVSGSIVWLVPELARAYSHELSCASAKIQIGGGTMARPTERGSFPRRVLNPPSCPALFLNPEAPLPPTPPFCDRNRIHLSQTSLSLPALSFTTINSLERSTSFGKF